MPLFGKEKRQSRDKEAWRIYYSNLTAALREAGVELDPDKTLEGGLLSRLVGPIANLMSVGANPDDVAKVITESIREGKEGRDSI